MEIFDLRIHEGRCQTLVHIEETPTQIKHVWRDTIKMYLESHFLKTDKPIEYEPLIRFVEEDFSEDVNDVFEKEVT